MIAVLDEMTAQQQAELLLERSISHAQRGQRADCGAHGPAEGTHRAEQAAEQPIRSVALSMWHLTLESCRNTRSPYLESTARRSH